MLLWHNRKSCKIFVCWSFLLIIDILSPAPRLTQGSASCHCFLRLVTKGRKDEQMCVYQKAMMYGQYL